VTLKKVLLWQFINLDQITGKEVIKTR